MAKGGYPRVAPCGTCGGTGVVYDQVKVKYTHNVKQPDGTWKRETYEVEEVKESKCTGPGPH